MREYKFISEYKNTDKYRLSFNELAYKTFGIDFERWYQYGFWNDSYVCYSYIDQDNIIANVSVSKLNIILDKKEFKGLQVGTVMTHQDYRNMGLSKSLMELMLKEIESGFDFVYLFANKSVLDFYPKFGFKKAGQYRFSSDIKIKSNYEKAKKLDINNEEDRKIIKRLSRERIPISQLCGVKNGEGILGWYCVNVFNENIFYLKEDDVIVIFEIENDVLHLYDIICKKNIVISELLEKISNSEVKRVIFYYTPDYKDIQITKEVYDDPDDTLFVKPILNVAKDIVFPLTNHA